MKFTKILTISCMLLAMASCSKEIPTPGGNEDSPEEFQASRSDKSDKGGKGGNKGKGGKGDAEDPVEPDPIEYTSTYRISDRDEFGPLYQFSFTEDESLVLFETDSTITSWGTDYWGFWADPYEYSNGVVQYFEGLSNIKYEFDEQNDGSFDVTSTVVRQPYPSGTPDTTITHLGIYSLLQ